MKELKTHALLPHAEYILRFVAQCSKTSAKRNPKTKHGKWDWNLDYIVSTHDVKLNIPVSKTRNDLSITDAGQDFQQHLLAMT